MPTRKNASGRWTYQKVVRLPDGRKVRISGRSALNTRRAAEEAERAHIARTLNPPPEPKRASPLFSDFARRWWETYPTSVGNKRSTLAEKELHLRVYLTPFFGDKTLDAIDAPTLTAFSAALATTDRHRPGFRPRQGKPLAPLAPKTRRNILQTLRKILACAQEWGELAVLPKTPKVRFSDPHWDFYRPEEVRTLIAAARTDEERAMLVCALHTGMRAGELSALRWEDIDLVGRQVAIRRSLWRGHEGGTKSGRERHVPLTPTLAEALERLPHRAPFVFCHADGRPYAVWYFAPVLAAVAQRAGLRVLRWHDLRHTYASLLVMAGVPIRRVQELLGHASIVTTQRYAHLSPDSDRTVAALEGLDPPKKGE